MNKKITMFFLCGLFAIFVIPSVILAASFDCSKATTKVEKMVCASPELSRLDESLSRAYQAAQKRFGKAAVLDQMRWLHRRDEYTNETLLKMHYESRIKELESAEYAAQPRRGTGAGRRAPSYFSETPIRSIDEMLEGCFANQKCASYAASLIPRYSKESGIDEDALRKTLKDCLADNSSMCICAGFQLFALENEFADVLSDAIEPAGERCEIAMEKHQETWEDQAAAKCDREARKEACDGTICGSIYPCIFLSCMEERYRERIKKLRSLGTCEPCSKCLNLP